MKKFLLCMMLAGLMMPVVAQEKVRNMRTMHVSELADRGASTPNMLPINPKGTLVDVDGFITAGISEGYDRQSQGGVYPMTKMHSDENFIACVWTNDDNDPSEFPGSETPRRGVGYTYSKDKGMTWSPQETRLGGIPVYWPSYAQWGANGEAVMARSYDSYTWQDEINIKDGVVLFTRETRGEGEWTITPVPYPAGIEPKDGYFMAWGQMATSGENNQYIHIICPMDTDQMGGSYYHGYKTPMLYYRTQDGKNWEIEAEVMAEWMGTEWEPQSYYSDALSFAVQGNTIACSFINWGSHGYVIKSNDNGDTWNCIKFFDSPVLGEATPDMYADTCFIPTQGCLALDLDGKMHIAFSVLMTANSEQDGYLSYWVGLSTSFLSYWNEDMDPIDGAEEFVLNQMEDFVWYDYFDFDLSEEGQYYVISTVPKYPVIGYFTPVGNDNIFHVDGGIIQDWGTSSYGLAGCFSFPQMEVSYDGVLHLSYLGLLDGGEQDSRWLRHPYYTSRNTDGTWTQTEYMVNSIDLIDQEFAYLTSAGLGADQWYLMAQVDLFAGVNRAYSGHAVDHNETTNNYTFFFAKGVGGEAIEDVTYTPLTMNVLPNPASGQAVVTFEGRGNVTVYNMLGQAVYHAENVENTKTISLNNMTTGVYFVTVRSGNATATQKLIVQ